mmetsp:Transcript_17718/g.59772  ORF Transcript_17718/g.59772 Transcript_17718/m.59772 type:complete len:315 (+) Transcript_17718:1280-2224(+)
MQLGHDAVFLLLAQNVVDLRLLTDISEAEPGLEDAQVVEDLRVDKVEQRPELLERVLDGRAREEEAVLGVELLQLPDEAAVSVLHPLALVDDQIFEVEVRQRGAVDDAHLKRRDDDGEVLLLRVADLQRVGPHFLAVLFRPMVQHDSDRRRPLAELLDPVGQRRQRRRDDDRALDRLFTNVRHQRNDLNRLPEAHLVCQNPAQPVLVKSRQPAQALDLVALELAADHGHRLLHQRSFCFRLLASRLPDHPLDLSPLRAALLRLVALALAAGSLVGGLLLAQLRVYDELAVLLGLCEERVELLLLGVFRRVAVDE